jgi:hypothetical protein
MGEDKAAKVKYLLPLIIDAYIRDLHGFMPRMLKAKEKVDPEVLRERLLVIGARTAGKGLISNVVIGDIIEQPSR